jgi:hypothetical protein
MRTTLTLDDDVAAALKLRARNLDQPFKRVVNDAIRRGLNGAEPRKPYRMKAGWPLDIESAFGHLDDIRDTDGRISMNKLAGELENQELLHKMREGR